MNRISSIATVAVALAGLSACNVVRDTNKVIDQVTHTPAAQATATTTCGAGCSGGPGDTYVAPAGTSPAACYRTCGMAPSTPCTSAGCAPGPSLPPPSSTSTTLPNNCLGTSDPFGMSCP